MLEYVSKYEHYDRKKLRQEKKGITPPEQVRESDRPKKFFFLLFSFFFTRTLDIIVLCLVILL